MSGSGTLKRATDQEVVMPEAPTCYGIPKDDWERLRGIVSRIKKPSVFFEILGSTFFGAAIATLIAVLTNTIPEAQIPSAKIITAFCFVISALCGFFVFTQRGQSIAQVREATEHMNFLENRFKDANAKDDTPVRK